MAEKEYTRLTRGSMRRTGAFAAFATRASLWLGKDHLLCIDTSGYTEDYKRFFFRDIQAITLRKTGGMRTRAAIYGFLAGVCALLALVIQDLGATVIMSIIGVPCAILLVANLALGPMSVCQIHTAVQSEELPSMNRLRRARGVLDRVRPLIEAAQGRLSPAELQFNLTNPPLPESPPVIARYAAPKPPEPIRHAAGKTHLVLFCLLLADLPGTVTAVAFKSDWMDALGWLMVLLTVGFAIAALIRQHNTDLPPGLRSIPKFSLAANVLFFVTSVGYGFYFVVTNPGAARHKLDVLEDPFVMAMTVISTTISVVLGALGLIRLRRFRASAAPPTPAPPPAIN